MTGPQFDTDKKILSREQLVALRQSGQMGDRVVFTNGCFDLLHVGHLQTLSKARSLGTHLVVGVNSDASVRSLKKGDSRPLVAEYERSQMLAALECVDSVVIFEESTPLDLLAVLRPEVHVKGGDYSVESLPETPVVRSWGGEVIIAPLIPSRSTSSLERALNAMSPS
jgi:rfaE bifunctional protein nucleotidyltransferase chain/domain